MFLVRFDGIPHEATGEIVRKAFARGIGIYPAAPGYLDSDACPEVELVFGFARLDPPTFARAFEPSARSRRRIVSCRTRDAVICRHPQGVTAVRTRHIPQALR
jgi:hypothetical protein